MNIYICMYSYIRTYEYVCIYTHVCVCVYTYIYMYIYMYIYDDILCHADAVGRRLDWHVDRLTPGCSKLTKSLQQAFNPNLLGPSDGDLNLKAHNNTVGMLKIHLCFSHIGLVLRLPGAVSLVVLHDASFWITLTGSSRSGRY